MNRLALAMALGAAALVLTYMYITHIPVYVSVYGATVDPVARVDTSGGGAQIYITGIVYATPSSASYMRFKFGGDGSTLFARPEVYHAGVSYSWYRMELVQVLETKYPVEVYICDSYGGRDYKGLVTRYTYTAWVDYNGGELKWSALCFRYTQKDDYVGTITMYVTYFNATQGKSGTIYFRYVVERES